MNEGVYTYYIGSDGRWYYNDLSKPLHYMAKVKLHSPLFTLHGDVGYIGTYDQTGFQFRIDDKWLFIPWNNISYLEYIVESK